MPLGTGEIIMRNRIKSYLFIYKITIDLLYLLAGQGDEKNTKFNSFAYRYFSVFFLDGDKLHYRYINAIFKYLLFFLQIVCPFFHFSSFLSPRIIESLQFSSLPALLTLKIDRMNSSDFYNKGNRCLLKLT